VVHAVLLLGSVAELKFVLSLRTSVCFDGFDCQKNLGDRLYHYLFVQFYYL